MPHQEVGLVRTEGWTAESAKLIGNGEVLGGTARCTGARETCPDGEEQMW